MGMQTMFCESGIMQGNCHSGPGGKRDVRIPSWYEQGLKQNLQLSGGAAAVAPQCAKHVGSGNEWMCLYANETLPYITTPIFAVNQLLSVWDAQCLNEGQPSGNILQLSCSVGGNYFRGLHACVQYIDLCDASVIQNWWAPAQEQYLTDFKASGVLQKPGNGGFLHQCYLGAYFEEFAASTNPAKVPKPQPGVWDQIAVGGKTMHAAISEWWASDGTKPAAYLADQAWDPKGTPPPGT